MRMSTRMRTRMRMSTRMRMVMRMVLYTGILSKRIYLVKDLVNQGRRRDQAKGTESGEGDGIRRSYFDC